MGFIHNIDPVIFEIKGIYFWYYGLIYFIGFLGFFLWLKYKKEKLNLSEKEIYEASILLALGILIFGRLIEVFFYEWPFYQKNLLLIPAYWLGGMSTHGVLLGALIGIITFCKLRKKNILQMLSESVIPAAIFMAIGRIGNFIDGNIIGSQTNVWWAVKFPYAEGFRHPVVLYDGLKNLLLVPILLWVKKLKPNSNGLVVGHFVFWYGFLRFFVDIFREYPVQLFGLGLGQNFNLVMSIVGLGMIVYFSKKKERLVKEIPSKKNLKKDSRIYLWILRIILIFLIIFSLLIPSDWTQNVVSFYGTRHLMDNASSIYKLAVLGY